MQPIRGEKQITTINVLAGNATRVDLDTHKIRITHEDGKQELITAREFIDDKNGIYVKYGTVGQRIEMLKQGETKFEYQTKPMSWVEIKEARKMMAPEYQRSVSAAFRGGSVLSRSLEESVKQLRGGRH